MIYHINLNIRPGGGPAGYLFNLKELNDKYEGDLHFVSVDYSKERTAPSSGKLNKFHSFFMLNILLKILIYTKYIMFAFKIKRRLNANESDVLVFHDQILAYFYNKLFSQKYFVMPHQPNTITNEACNAYHGKYGICKDYLYGWLSQIELAVYENAQTIILPTKYSLDSYFDGIVCQKYSHKFVEILSTVSFSNTTNHQNLEKRTISFPLTIGFIGRYNKDKGYDKYNAFARKYSSNKIKFVSAGVGDIAPDVAIDNYGWITDTAKIFDICDIILIPNRFTYFDLLPVEALTNSIPLFVTNEGGNKRLLELFEGRGVSDISDLDSYLDNIDSSSVLSVELEHVLSVFDERKFVEKHEAING